MNTHRGIIYYNVLSINTHNYMTPAERFSFVLGACANVAIRTNVRCVDCGRDGSVITIYCTREMPH